jgi:hypothetical protein
MFENEQEFCYFRHYCDETIANLAGAFELPIWSRVILQASHDQAYIRHAVISIGKLSKRARVKLANDSEYSSPAQSIYMESPSRDESFVLQHYNKFLQGSRRALSSGHQGTRMALIVCLLIICVEGLQWHHRSVFKHLTGGINLLDEWVRGQKKPPALPGISSPSPDVVEDEIVEQFRTLELEASVLYDPKPQEDHERLRAEGNETIDRMPETFNSTHEARQYLELIMRRSHHFLGTVVPQKPDPSTQEGDLDSQSLVVSFNNFKTFNGAGQSLHFEQERYEAELRRWMVAFQPLFQSRTPSHKDFLFAQLLKIRARVLGILLAGELSTSETIYDHFLPDFEEILSMAKSFLAHPGANKIIVDGSYASNAGLIFPLRLIADRSRSRSLRREAISLLKSKAWREGSFSSSSTAQISEWLMEIEEEGVETEYIPEWARTRLVHVDIDEGKGFGRVSVKCLRGIGTNQQAKEATWEWGLPGPRSESGTPRSSSSRSMSGSVCGSEVFTMSPT